MVKIKNIQHDMKKIILLIVVILLVSLISASEGWNWVQVKDLKVGDKLMDSDGNEVLIESIEKVNDNVKVYDLEIDKYHYYFAENVLVHNSVAQGDTVLDGITNCDQVKKVITQYASTYGQGIDPNLFIAIAYKESSCNPAISDSSSGAVGVMQLMPGTFNTVMATHPEITDPNIRNVRHNIIAGMSYFASLMVKYRDLYEPFVTSDAVMTGDGSEEGDRYKSQVIALSLASYNGGPGYPCAAIQKWLNVKVIYTGTIDGNCGADTLSAMQAANQAIPTSSFPRYTTASGASTVVLAKTLQQNMDSWPTWANIKPYLGTESIPKKGDATQMIDFVEKILLGSGSYTHRYTSSDSPSWYVEDFYLGLS
ncbi:MAG: transglycosylase SLT domain-containing protein [Nanoarchaeota archaeon]